MTISAVAIFRSVGPTHPQPKRNNKVINYRAEDYGKSMERDFLRVKQGLPIISEAMPTIMIQFHRDIRKTIVLSC